MNVLHRLESFPDRQCPVFLALGCFDGLHVGHRAVLGIALSRARETAGEAWAFAFSPHPAKVLDPDRAPALICTLAQQERLLQETGMDGLLLQHFTKPFMHQTPETFFDRLLDAVPGLAGLSVGADWSFGKDRAGTPERMAALCAERNLFFSAHPPVLIDGARVSSTRIRQAVAEGRMAEARTLLGRPFSVVGTVVHGERIGRTLGFPTANVTPENELLPARGIYAARVRVGRRIHPAAAYVGRRESFRKDGPQVLEAHLLEQPEIDLYDKRIEIEYLDFVRNDRRFDDPEALKRQIRADLERIDAILRRESRAEEPASLT